MEFLPIEKDGSAVYAGFWKRFGASLVDSFVLFPVGMILILLENISISSAIAVTVISSIFFAAYTIFFHYRYGATLGKFVIAGRAVSVRPPQPKDHPAAPTATALSPAIFWRGFPCDMWRTRAKIG